MNAGDIDVLNNPYFSFSGYQFSLTGLWFDFKELEICSDEYVDSFVIEGLQSLYTQPLCFKEKEKVYVRGNFRSEVEEIVVGYRIRYCVNSTENGDWCKSKDEVDEWLF